MTPTQKEVEKEALRMFRKMFLRSRPDWSTFTPTEKQGWLRLARESLRLRNRLAKAYGFASADEIRRAMK